MEYMVIQVHMNQKGFIAKVNEAIANGWRPQGGVFYNNGSLYQAMIRG